MRIPFWLLLVLSTVICKAQTDSISSRKANHYLGIQANQLLRQLFNLSNNSSVVVNPYLINYSVNSIRSGWGLNVGLGYTVDNSSTQNDPNTSQEVTSNSFALRVGVERKKMIGKKWMFSYGFDLLMDKGNNTATTKSQFQFSSSETKIESTTKDSGYGPRFTMNFLITHKIILGTEASYYLKFININQTISNSNTNIFIDPNTGQQTVSSNSSTNTTNNDYTQFKFVSPAVIFLILKF